MTIAVCEHDTRNGKRFERFIDAYEYAEWIHKITQDFNFGNLIKGLNWFANSSCPSCLKGGGMPRCEVRVCCLRKNLKNCYFCEEFSGCEKLSYQKETYKIGENYERIKQIGYANWLREQEEKTKESIKQSQIREFKRSRKFSAEG